MGLLLKIWNSLTSKQIEQSNSEALNVFEDAYEKYEEIVSDLGECDPASAISLTEYTNEITRLSLAFELLTSAFYGLDSSLSCHTSAAALYKIYCRHYIAILNTYLRTANDAMTTALQSQIQFVKDEFNLDCLKYQAAHPAEQEIEAIRAKVIVAEAKLIKDTADAKTLREAADIATEKAKALLAEANSVDK